MTGGGCVTVAGSGVEILVTGSSTELELEVFVRGSSTESAQVACTKPGRDATDTVSCTRGVSAVEGFTVVSKSLSEDEVGT